jgi:Focadhesin
MNQEYENFMKEILSRLWHMIQWSDLHGIKCALDCLKSWNYDAMTLDTIPVAYRDGIALPEAPPGMEVSILDLEVPGECFVQLLTKVHPDARQAAGDLLAHYIGCEITEFRSGHYIVKEGQSEPINYKNLPKQSILKALVTFVLQQATTRKADKLVEEALLVESLRVLAQKYCRPLPPLNWCFLHDLIHKSDEIKAQCFFIAAKQAVISGTAKRLIENFLANLDKRNEEDVEIALDALVDICNGVSPDVLKSFSEYLFKTQSDDITEKVKNCLRREKDVTNRENLATLLSIFIGLNKVNSELIRLIPPKVLDMITFQLTTKQKIEFRCEILKTNSEVENPIAWVSELMTEQSMLNDNRKVFTEAFQSLLEASDVFPKRKWIADFIIMMQNRLVEKDVEKDKITFLLDIFIISVVIASGYSITSTQDNVSKNLEIFPSCIELVSRQPAYDDLSGKIFEFLLHLINLDSLDETTRDAFKSAIIISKNHVYFRKAKVWQRFLMIR